MIKAKLTNIRLTWSPTIFKGTLVAMLLAAFFIPVAIVGLPFIEFFNDMAAQPKAKTQMTYGRIYGKKIQTERLAVPGTIPMHGGETYPFLNLGKTNGSKDDGGVESTGDEPKVDHELIAAKQVGELLSNPEPRTLASLNKGRELFDIFCITCHGDKGHGDGPIVGPDRFPAPPSLHTDRVLDFPDGTLFHFVTMGYKTMPPYADKLEPAHRWMTIHYVRALQRAMNPKKEDLGK